MATAWAACWRAKLPNVLDLPFHSLMAMREVLVRNILGQVFRASSYSGDLATPRPVTEIEMDLNALGRLHEKAYRFGGLDYSADDPWPLSANYDRLSEVYALVESEPVAESTALDGPEAFESQYVSAELTSARPLEEARLRILPRVRGDVWQIARSAQRRQSAGELTEPVELPAGTTLTNSSGQQTTPSSSSQTSLQLTAFYGYDPFDRRIARVLVAASSTYLHVYDGRREIEALLVEPSTGTTTAVKQFLWGERLDEVVAYRRVEVVQGSLEWVSYHVTQLGHESITRVIDDEGDLLEQSVYDPDGKCNCSATHVCRRGAVARRAQILNRLSSAGECSHRTGGLAGSPVRRRGSVGPRSDVGVKARYHAGATENLGQGRSSLAECGTPGGLGEAVVALPPKRELPEYCATGE